MARPFDAEALSSWVRLRAIDDGVAARVGLNALLCPRKPLSMPPVPHVLALTARIIIAARLRGVG